MAQQGMKEREVPFDLEDMREWDARVPDIAARIAQEQRQNTHGLNRAERATRLQQHPIFSSGRIPAGYSRSGRPTAGHEPPRRRSLARSSSEVSSAPRGVAHASAAKAAAGHPTQEISPTLPYNDQRESREYGTMSYGTPYSESRQARHESSGSSSAPRGDAPQRALVVGGPWPEGNWDQPSSSSWHEQGGARPRSRRWR